MGDGPRCVAHPSSLPALWRGPFGTAYTARNPVEGTVGQRVWFFRRALHEVRPPARVLEVGCNAGGNLQALGRWAGDGLEIVGVDVHHAALVAAATTMPAAMVTEADAQALPFAAATFDLVLTCGLLIHIPPHQLARVYAELIRVCRRTLLIAEYFSPGREARRYRAHTGLLWRADFGRELLEAGRERLALVDYGCLRKVGGDFDDLDFWVLDVC